MLVIGRVCMYVLDSADISITSSRVLALSLSRACTSGLQDTRNGVKGKKSILRRVLLECTLNTARAVWAQRVINNQI